MDVYVWSEFVYSAFRIGYSVLEIISDFFFVIIWYLIEEGIPVDLYIAIISKYVFPLDLYISKYPITTSVFFIALCILFAYICKRITQTISGNRNK
jgi:hypothetical protein